MWGGRTTCYASKAHPDDNEKGLFFAGLSEKE
jgi:hypothetical protein